MKILVALLAFVCLCEARPGRFIPVDEAHPVSYNEVDSFVIGGVNAAPGAWPWQLSQQRLGGSWSHSCGSSLLKVRHTLSAAHCIDGAAVSSVRVIAGLHDRSNTANTQTINLSTHKMHEQYNTGSQTYSNDIAILTLNANVNVGGNVQYGTLPPNNNNDFSSSTCVITGWGRTSSSNTLPNILQQANVGILTNAACVSAVGNGIWANHICIRDPQSTRGACNGDSGGPVNCPNGSGGYYVAGAASFVYQSNGNCLPNYPSVYTRSSAYLTWINNNTQ